MWLVAMILDSSDTGHFHYCRKLQDQHWSREWPPMPILLPLFTPFTSSARFSAASPLGSWILLFVQCQELQGNQVSWGLLRVITALCKSNCFLWVRLDPAERAQRLCCAVQTQVPTMGNAGAKLRSKLHSASVGDRKSRNPWQARNADVTQLLIEHVLSGHKKDREIWEFSYACFLRGRKPASSFSCDLLVRQFTWGSLLNPRISGFQKAFFSLWNESLDSSSIYKADQKSRCPGWKWGEEPRPHFLDPMPSNCTTPAGASHVVVWAVTPTPSPTLQWVEAGTIWTLWSTCNLNVKRKQNQSW